MLRADRKIADALSEPRLAAVVQAFGIERIARLTEMDDMPVEVVSSICPVSHDLIKVYSGKGRNLERALISSVMECVERTASAWRADDVAFASQDTLVASDEAVLPPGCFSEGKHPDFTPAAVMPWVRGESTGGKLVWVPADLIFWGRNRPPCAPVFQDVSTNGLAAHFDLDAAVVKARREIVERHVVSEIDLAAGDRELAALLSMSVSIGLPPGELASSFRYRTGEVPDLVPDEGSLSSRVASTFEQRAIPFYLKYLGYENGLHVVGCASTEVVIGGGRISCAGYAAHPCLSEAMDDAVLEMCQSRITDMHGAREDCGVDDKRRSTGSELGHWLLNPSLKRVKQSELLSAETAAEDVENLIYYRFKTPKEIAVVRAIAPGLQTWHVTAGQSDDFGRS